MTKDKAPRTLVWMTVQRKPIVFFHVMKCGGTSVRSALAAAAVSRAVKAHDGSETAETTPESPASGASEVSLESSSESGGPAQDERFRGPDIFELDGNVAKAAAGGTDRDNWLFRDALLPYVLQAMDPSVVLGHFRYRDRYHELVDHAHFITVLREPVDRIVSLYKYRRYKETVDVPVSGDFDEFLATPRWAKEGSLYVRTFCGRDTLEPSSDEAVAAAVANLQQFAVVGFTEGLADFSMRVTNCIGTPVSVPKYNTTPALVDPEIDEATLEHARAVCAPDIALYEQAHSLLA